MASREIAVVLRLTFPAATGLDFDVLAKTIVDRLDLAAAAYVDERHQAFDIALRAMMDYDGMVKADLHETIARLTNELADCHQARARFIKGEIPVDA